MQNDFLNFQKKIDVDSALDLLKENLNYEPKFN